MKRVFSLFLALLIVLQSIIAVGEEQSPLISIGEEQSLFPRLYPIRSLIRQVPLILKRIRKKALAIRMRKSVLRLPFPFRKVFRKG